ncbi:PREDICTED: C-type lectin domain family 2 member D-like [Gekko japonicus]|uniref:C-type lectin domain family 2 member D-like n=1 Tax=Gekko japonicus TaxID=146911 RepID=A0ABM1K9R4_GEKJA|nr:PREDICTED: C-type lectin domain family 2 member D-like [Gekko japonicus]
MAGSENKKPEGYHPVNSHIKENGESNGSISVYLNKHEAASLKPPLGLHFCVKRTPAFFIAGVSVILNLALVIALLVLSVRPRGLSPVCPTCPVVSCPSGWIGYQGRCYYFAKAEGNWTSSKKHCSSLNASLAVVDSQEEMEFMMRYKGFSDHWIGLERNQSQPWTWIDGTIFNGWFTILGGGSCAYMNQQGIASSSCSREEPWICSKPILR